MSARRVVCARPAADARRSGLVLPVAIDDEREERNRRRAQSSWTVGSPGSRDDMENGPGSRGRDCQLPMWSSAATTVDGILARPGSVATTTTIDGGSASDSRRVSQMVYERGASGAHSLSGGRSSLSPVPSSLPSSSRARFRVRGDSSALDANGLACCPWVG